MRGKLIVISGPSGVGKSTVLKRVMEQYDNLQFSVSATTRPIRPGEVDGVNYIFLNHDQFRQLIEEDQLLEYAEYVGNFYGTPVAPLEKALEEGKDILLDIEVQGALQVRKKFPDAILMFLMAPSLQIVEQRLRNRGDTAPELMKQRIERARWECSQADHYDYIIINETVETAANEVISVITAEKCKTKDRLPMFKED
ncbi:MAG: guanylate kinase [Oscillospiraceae bacterium]|nr:guanylate kinase [Oscillospiraceae bacterium]